MDAVGQDVVGRTGVLRHEPCVFQIVHADGYELRVFRPYGFIGFFQLYELALADPSEKTSIEDNHHCLVLLKEII